MTSYNLIIEWLKENNIKYWEPTFSNHKYVLANGIAIEFSSKVMEIPEDQIMIWGAKKGNFQLSLADPETLIKLKEMIDD